MSTNKTNEKIENEENCINTLDDGDISDLAQQINEYLEEYNGKIEKFTKKARDRERKRGSTGGQWLKNAVRARRSGGYIYVYISLSLGECIPPRVKKRERDKKNSELRAHS